MPPTYESEDAAPEDAGAEDPAAAAVRDPHRLALRTFADKVMDKARDIPKPTSFLEGERAARYGLSARRMLVQLYEAPKPRLAGSAGGEDGYGVDLSEDDRTRFWRETMLARLDQVTILRAKDYGFWPSGAPYDEGKDDPKAHMYEFVTPPEGEAETPEPFTVEQLPEFLIRRLNHMAWYHGRHHGRLPDGSPFDPEGPPWLHLSVNVSSGAGHPAPDETSVGPWWWVVRRRLPSDPPAKAPPPE